MNNSPGCFYIRLGQLLVRSIVHSEALCRWSSRAHRVGRERKKVPVVCDFCRSAVCRRCAVSAAPGVGYFCKCAGSHAETELGRLSAARRRRSGFCFLAFCCLAKSCASRLRRLFSAAASRSWCSWSCTYQLGCINALCPIGEFAAEAGVASAGEAGCLVWTGSAQRSIGSAGSR